MAKIVPIKRKSVPVVQEIANDLIKNEPQIKQLLILTVEIDESGEESVNFRTYDPQNDLPNLLMAYKLMGREIDQAVDEAYS
jgi:hypothetical protein